jgi:hypothetical protein
MKRKIRSNASLVGFKLAMGASINDLTLDSTRKSAIANTVACEVAVRTQEATIMDDQYVSPSTPEFETSVVFEEIVFSQFPQVMVAVVATASSKSVGFPLTVRGSMMMR